MSSVRPRRTIADLTDTRSFEQGDIWIIRDNLLAIPDADVQGRVIHSSRPVIILHETPLNSSPTFPTVMVVPLSHELSFKKSCDLELHPEEGSVVKPCLARLGLAQPVLKIDLFELRGKLTDQQLKDLLTMQVLHLGLLETE